MSRIGDRMSNKKAIEELVKTRTTLEYAVEDHRRQANEHTAIADELFRMSNKVDRQIGQLENEVMQRD
jgi:hypothetical protein